MLLLESLIWELWCAAVCLKGDKPSKVVRYLGYAYILILLTVSISSSSYFRFAISFLLLTGEIIFQLKIQSKTIKTEL